MIALKQVNYKKRFVIRTIRNGKVKVFGHWFTPREEYNGELDGLRYVFGVYYTGDTMMATLYLWGTETLYNSETQKEMKVLYELEPHHVDGHIRWLWWDAL